MLENLKCDIKRYIQLALLDENVSLWKKFLILLSSRGLYVVAVHRLGFWVNTRYKAESKSAIKYLFKFLYYLGTQFCVFIFKTSISVSTEIGPGLYLSNKGGIIVGARKLGSRCTIHHNVTIGVGIRDGSLPEVGDRVWIGPDSVIFGKIRIGHGTVIKPSTVVSKRIPERSVVSGYPCLILNRDFDNSSYLLHPSPDYEVE